MLADSFSFFLRLVQEYKLGAKKEENKQGDRCSKMTVCGQVPKAIQESIISSCYNVPSHCKSRYIFTKISACMIQSKHFLRLSFSSTSKMQQFTKSLYVTRRQGTILNGSLNNQNV